MSLTSRNLINSVPESNIPLKRFPEKKEKQDVPTSIKRKPVNAAVRVSTELTANIVEVDDREHVQIYEKNFTLFETFANLLGIQSSYHWIPHQNPMFLVTMFLVFFTWFCIFYTQYIHIKNGAYVRVLEVCALYGVVTSCTQKILGYLKKCLDVMSLFFCIRQICRRTECGCHADILTTHLRRTLRFLKLFAVGVAACTVLFGACPFKSYVFDNELVSLLPIEIIFVNQDTYSGFAFANIVMSILGILATMGTVLYGAVFIYAVSMYLMQVDLIGQDFKDLDCMWAEDSTVPLTCKHALLRNICKKLQDIIDFMDVVRDIFEKKFFYYFCFNYVSQIICLFEIATNQWLPGYGIALALFIEMMFYCAMGSQITFADERLCSIIYNANWHKYDIKSQKMHRSQQLGELSLGPIGPLTVLTGIEVIKSIYSYYTVLTELL